MKRIVILALFAIVVASCGTVTFNMSGATVGNASTCQVNFFENQADNVNPRLGALITDELKDKIQSSTRLRLVNNNADVMFEGEVTGYNIQPQQITAAGRPQMDRLTITVRVRFTNELDTEKNYDRSFSRFQEAASGTITVGSSVENNLIELILVELMEDIFNAAFATW